MKTKISEQNPKWKINVNSPLNLLLKVFQQRKQTIQAKPIRLQRFTKTRNIQCDVNSTTQ